MTPRSWEHWVERYEGRGHRVLAPAYPGLEVKVEALNEDPSPIEALTIPAIVEHRRTPEEFAYVRAIPNYSAVRTSRYNYVEYETGEKELYDLNADPTELTNIYNRAPQTLRSDLKARLDALKTCARAGTSATSCKRAEGG
jgi:hypothetical protein